MKKIKIYGGPGTGKTSEMLSLLEQEIDNGVKLGRIAFVTHTVAARDEARKRAMARMPHASEADFRYFKTIHGICYFQIGLNRANVFQSEDYISFGDFASVPFSRDFTDDLDDDGIPLGFNHSLGNEILAIRQLAAAYSTSAFDPNLMALWPKNINPLLVKDVLDKYDQYKYENSKFDFVDMLDMYLGDDYNPLPIDVLFIDEAQDLSRKQWMVVNKFMANAQRAYISGDDDQSIYNFIGSDPQGFYKYPCDEVRILPTTHRLPKPIWEYANRLISQISDRQVKNIQTEKEDGQIDYWSLDPSLIEIDPNKTTMIIARHHKQLSAISSRLERLGAPFTHKGRSVVGTMRARALHAYFVARSGSAISLRSAAEILKMAGLKDLAKNMRERARLAPNDKIEPGKIGVNFEADWVEYLAQNKTDKQQNDLLRLVLNQRGLDAIKEKPKLDLSTYHGSKGREAKHIILLTDCYKSAWEHNMLSPEDEIRLAYVGITRAEEKCTIVAPRSNLYMRAFNG